MGSEVNIFPVPPKPAPGKSMKALLKPSEESGFKDLDNDADDGRKLKPNNTSSPFKVKRTRRNTIGF